MTRGKKARFRAADAPLRALQGCVRGAAAAGHSGGQARAQELQDRLQHFPREAGARRGHGHGRDLNSGDRRKLSASSFESQGQQTTKQCLTQDDMVPSPIHLVSPWNTHRLGNPPCSSTCVRQRRARRGMTCPDIPRRNPVTCILIAEELCYAMYCTFSSRNSGCGLGARAQVK